MNKADLDLIRELMRRYRADIGMRNYLSSDEKWIMQRGAILSEEWLMNHLAPTVDQSGCDNQCNDARHMDDMKYAEMIEQQIDEAIERRHEQGETDNG